MKEQNPTPDSKELRHQIELLRERMEAHMKVSQSERKEAKAESDSALERLRVTIADHNAKVAEYHAKMAEQSKDIIKFIATMSGISVAVLGAFIALLQFYK